MATTCEQIGHDFQGTTALGWFQCTRIIGSTKKKSLPIFCGAVAVCPGCLGYAIAGMQSLLCVIHFPVCQIADFPVVESVVTDAHTVEQSAFEQSSLW